MDLLGFLHPKRHGLTEETKLAATHSILSSEGKGSSLTDELQKAEDFTNYLMSHDDAIEEPLESDFTIGEGNKKEINPISLALRVLLSPLNRLSFIDPYAADTYKLEVENLIEIMGCDMDEDEFESGGDFLLESYKLAIRIALDDAKKGHKAQIIKMRQTVSRVTVGSESERVKNERQGGNF